MATPNDPPRRGSSPPAGQRRHASGSYRTEHRSRSHDSAHAESAGGAPDAPPPPEHPLVPRGAVPLVDTDVALAALLGRLRAAGSFAYDSEFIGELTYHPKLCLIQVASAFEVALIDPLARMTLTPFWELLCDPVVEKIVHAGQQDIEPVVRHLGRAPANLFDTQIAAGLAALPYPVALSKLVHEFAGARLGKGLTFTHWDQRPLSSMQLRYAADDVRFLPRIRAEIGRRLDELGHAEWAREECAAQCDPALYRFDAEAQYLRVRGAGSLQPRNLAVLRALTAWRDTAARAADVPPRSFLKDEILVDMARTPVRSAEKLDRVRGLPRPVESEYGSTIVEVTLRALDLPAPDLPTARDVEPVPTEKFRADALWSAAQSLCASQGIDPSLAASRQEFGDFYQKLRDGAPLEGQRLFRGWRRSALGQPIADLVNGAAAFGCRWSGGELKPL